MSGKNRRSEGTMHMVMIYSGKLPNIRSYNSHISIARGSPEDPNLRYTVNQRQRSMYISGSQRRSESNTQILGNMKRSKKES